MHKTVLLHESIDGLDIRPGDIYVDGTLGSGGHAYMALTKGAKVIGIDEDDDALARSRQKLEHQGEFLLVHGNYRNLDKILDKLSIGNVQKIMLDIGLSSDQFEASGRGFTFKNDEPLLMTFKKYHDHTTLTAKEILNTWDESNIADIIYGYGEERYARRIARVVVERRAKKSIETTGELVDIINEATPWFYRKGKIHPATRTFQALRITVNDELGALKEGISKGFARLSPGGRMAVISFHSLEDRIVKQYFRELATKGEASVLTKRPIIASESELKENPRARSAKLRIIEKNK